MKRLEVVGVVLADVILKWLENTRLRVGVAALLNGTGVS